MSLPIAHEPFPRWHGHYPIDHQELPKCDAWRSGGVVKAQFQHKCRQQSGGSRIPRAVAMVAPVVATAAARIAQRRRRLRRPPAVPRVFLADARKLGVAGVELRRLIRACGRPLRQGFRVNPLRGAEAPPQDLLQRLRAHGWKLDLVPWCGDGFGIVSTSSEAASFGLSRPALVGEIYGQEPTSMLPPVALTTAVMRTRSSTEGLRVLDLCSAPGSKATQLAAWLDGSGLLASNEMDETRVRVLRKNMLRAGVTNSIITCADGRILGELVPESFDAVLVDAPCSSSGNVRKHADALNVCVDATDQEWLESLSSRQWELLQSAWAVLRPGGVLVYSTCTLNERENESQCHRLMEAHGNSCRPVPLASLLGMPEAASSGDFIRIWPHVFDTEGFFLGCFHKLSPEPPNMATEASSSSSCCIPPSSDSPSFADAPSSASSTSPSPASPFISLPVSPALTDCLSSAPTPSSSSSAPAPSVGPPLEGISRGSDLWQWQRQGLKKVDSTRAVALQNLIEAQVGNLLVGDWLNDLCEDSDGNVWLVPSSRLCSNLRGLIVHAPWPGICLVRGSAPSQIADDALLLAIGDRNAGNLLDMSEDDLSLLAARVEGGEGILKAKLETEAYHGHVDEAEQLLAEMARRRVSPKLDSYNMLLHSYANSGKANKVAKAKTLVSQMDHRRIDPDVITQTTLMKVHMADGELKEAALAFQSIREHALTPDLVAFNALLEVRARQRNLPGAKKTFSDMKDSGVVPDIESYRTFLKTYSVVGDNVGAEKTYALMVEQKINPDLQCYTALIQSCSSPAGGGNLARAQQLFEAMSVAGLEPNKIHYNALLDVYANCNDEAGARELVERMQEQSVQPDSASFTSLMKVSAKKGHVEEVEQIFEEMQACDLQPDLQCYTMLLKAIAVNPSQEDVDWAWEVLDHMRTQRLTPNEVHYTSLLGAYAHTCDSQGADKVFREMRAHGLTPDLVSHNMLMKLHVESGNAPAALEVLVEARKQRLSPSVKSYGTLLKAYARGGDAVRARQVFDQLGQQGLQPDLMCYNMLIKSLARASDIDECDVILEDIRTHRMTPDLVSYSTLMAEYANRGDVSSVEQVFQKITDQRLRPDDVCFKMRDKAKLRARG